MSDLTPTDQLAVETARTLSEATKQARMAERARRFDLDVRGVLAIMAILGTFALAFTQLFLKGTAEIPAWTAGIGTGIIGWYFGAKGGSNGK